MGLGRKRQKFNWIFALFIIAVILLIYIFLIQKENLDAFIKKESWDKSNEDSLDSLLEKENNEKIDDNERINEEKQDEVEFNDKKIGLAPIQVSINQVIDASHYVANSMEGTRKIPSTIIVGAQSLTPAQYLSLASTSLKRIIEDPIATPSTLVDVPPSIAEPLNQYPSTNLRSLDNKALYSEPLTIEGYSQIINAIQSSIGATAPQIINYNNGQIRYPEAIYFVSHILRFYKFFSKLPSSQSLFVISPKGLVRWEVPVGYESYTDVTHNYFLSPDSYSYYTHNPHYYDVYSLAQEIIGGSTDTYTVGQRIYDWSKRQGWLDIASYTGTNSRGFEDYTTSEMLRSRRGSSAVPYLYNFGLMRAINIPNDGELAYINGKWLNIDNHLPYGLDVSDPSVQVAYGTNNFFHTAPPPAEIDYLPKTDDGFIQNIKTISVRATSSLPSMTLAIFINPGDVKKYGAQYIVDKVASGGFSTIIFTVKPIWGGLYYNSLDSEKVQDLLSPLITEAKKRNLRVYAAFSVLTDFNTIYTHPDWKSVYVIARDYPRDAVSPCIASYKQRMKNLISEVVNNHKVDGIVLAGIHLSSDYDNNPACIDKASTNWRERLITSYATELTQYAKQICVNCDVRILSVSMRISTNTPNRIYSSDWNNNVLMNQNLVSLSSLGDGLILPFVENGWLMQASYLFPTVTQYLRDKSGVMPGISLYLSDEWEFTPEFYNGIIQYAYSAGINFFALHSPLSLEGEYGYSYHNIINDPGFMKSQYMKISYISTISEGSCIPTGSELCDGKDNDCDSVIDNGGNLDCSGGTPYCSGGKCVQCTNNIQCNDNNPCTDDLCNAGACSNINDNTNSCSDALFCNGAESCSTGSCIRTPRNTEDGISCTTGSCDETNDRIIQTPDNSKCYDGLWCNGYEVCDLSLGCKAGTPVVCDDGISCTRDDCFEDVDSTDNIGRCVAYTNTCNICGNRKIESGEICDQGNTINGDGCSSTCQTENGWSCSGQPSVCMMCTLTDAQWSGINTIQGQSVQLTVTGNNCNGKILDFVIWEDDTVDADDPANINPTSVTFSGTSATTTWTAEWQCDGDLGGVCTYGNPEYYFNAILREDNRINIISLGRANGILQTTASSATCRNSIVETGEQCDDGNAINTDSCTNICKNAVCGDTIVRTGVEVCDGNSIVCTTAQGYSGTQTCNLQCSAFNTCFTIEKCGDGVLNGNEVCDDGLSNGQPTYCNAQCTGITTPICGNRAVEAGEQCDDGNAINTDSCISCKNAVCGDNLIRTGVEICDDGVLNGQPNKCNSLCTGITTGVCGNGIPETGEQCDDGNTNNNDACISCLNARCGDGYTRTGVETCDDGALNGQSNKCNSLCTGITSSVCGNNVPEAGEQCDDGNTNNNDACTNSCRTAICGDTIIRTGVELCDGNNQVCIVWGYNGIQNCNAQCSAFNMCTPTERCGDNVIQASAGESCDDGNIVDGDDCTNACLDARCGDGITRTGIEECDVGSSGNSQCTTLCKLTYCGDSIIQNPNGYNINEICDSNTRACSDNGYNGFAGCSGTCLNYGACVSTERCGDTIIQAAAGEECEDGNNIDRDGCSALCKNEVIGSLPDLLVISPEAREYKNVPVPLEFIASNADSCYYLLDGIRKDTTCNVNEILDLRPFVSGPHKIEVFVKNSNGQTVKSVDFNVVYTRQILINYAEYKGKGETTDLEGFSDLELENIELVLDDGIKGKIKFNEKLNLALEADLNKIVDLDSNVNIDDKKIEIKADVLKGLNKKATLTFRNINFNDPKIQRDGNDCNAPNCVEVSYSNRIYVVDVSGFSVYTVVEGQQPPPPSGGGDTGGSSGGGSGGGISIDTGRREQEAEEKDNETIGLIMINGTGEELERIEISQEEIQNVNVGDGTRVVFEVEGSNIGHVIDFVVEDDKVILKVVRDNREYKILRNDIVKLLLENKEVYLTIRDIAQGRAIITLGLEKGRVKEEIGVVKPKFIVYILTGIVAMLILIIGLMILRYKRGKF